MVCSICVMHKSACMCVCVAALCLNMCMMPIAWCSCPADDKWPLSSWGNRSECTSGNRSVRYFTVYLSHFLPRLPLSSSVSWESLKSLETLCCLTIPAVAHLPSYSSFPWFPSPSLRSLRNYRTTHPQRPRYTSTPVFAKQEFIWTVRAVAV